MAITAIPAITDITTITAITAIMLLIFRKRTGIIRTCHKTWYKHIVPCMNSIELRL